MIEGFEVRDPNPSIPQSVNPSLPLASAITPGNSVLTAGNVLDNYVGNMPAPSDDRRNVTGI